MKRALRITGWLTLAAGLAVTVVVEREAPHVIEQLGGAGPRAVVLYHPSRDAHFSDELSLAVAEGLKEAGYRVERETTTRLTAAERQGVAFIAIVSNTYYWTPDLPTLRLLRRAHLTGIPVCGIIGGAGSTGRSERVFAEALRRTGARVLGVRSLWVWRPNDEQRMDEPNRRVARDIATAFARDAARRALAVGSTAR